MANGDDGEKKIVRNAIEQGDRNAIRDILRIVDNTGALDYTMAQAEKQANQAIAALSVLPDSAAKQALEDLARFAISRNR